MEELIYRFLLQSGFPRAALVTEYVLLTPASRGRPVPAFGIVDPDTAHPLGVVEVVGAVDREQLLQVAAVTANHARQLGGQLVQGFVVRVDTSGSSEAEQVQFYRVWPNRELQQLSAATFPDLETLRVSRKLNIAASPGTDANSDGESLQESVREVAASQSRANAVADEAASPPRLSAGAWLPALLLLALLVADFLVLRTRGTPLLDVAQAVSIVGLATLLSLPAYLRFMRK